MTSKPRRKSKGRNPSSWIRRSKRHRIYMRDKYCCVYCERWLPTKKLTLDHVKKRSQGGSNHQTNLVTACIRCNSSLQHKTLREWCELTKKNYKEVYQRVRNALRRKLPQLPPLT